MEPMSALDATFLHLEDANNPLHIGSVAVLEDGRWGLISKVHHCMVDGVSATDLMTLIFDASREGSTAATPPHWAAEPEPGRAER